MSFASLIFHLLMILSCRAEDNSTSDGNNSTLVQTSHGLVQGRTFTSPWTNKTTYAFQGIPYAAPPVGSLRFKVPVPALHTTDVPTTETLPPDSTPGVSKLAKLYEATSSTTYSPCPACPVTTCPTASTATVPPATTPAADDGVCRTNQCHVMASRILSLINISVDPCEDFYSYACGGIFNSPTLLEEDLAEDVWRRLESAVKSISSKSPLYYQKLKKYYTGCVNYDKLTPVEERKKQGRLVLDSVAKFADPSTPAEDLDLTELLVKLFQLGSAPLFDLKLDVDSTNSSKFQVVITIPNWMSSHFITPEEKTQRCRHKSSDSISLDLNHAYDEYKECIANFADFIDTIEKALEFFEVFNYLPPHNASNLIHEIRMYVELGISALLKDYTSLRESQRDIQGKMYRSIPMIQLESEIPMISWSYLFSTLLGDDISGDTNVQFYFMDQITSLFKNLEPINLRSVYNSVLAIFANDLYNDIVLTRSSCDRERYCLRVTTNLAPLVTSNLYLDTFPPDAHRELRQQATQTYQELVSSMDAYLDKSKWMDNITFDRIKNKLKFMSLQLPVMFNESLLITSLELCNLDSSQYLEDSVCLLRQFQAHFYSLYTKDPHSSDAMWPHFLSAFSTNAAFIYGLNTFMVPMSVIPPVYDKQMPKHVIMARLGNVLARGIGHNFDRTGVQFSASGKIGMMLSEDTYQSYKAVEDNSNYQLAYTKARLEDGRAYQYMIIDPELTLNERLADITAANLSLNTVLGQKDTVLPWVPFTSEQVYFIVLAQNFCSKKKMPEIFTHLYEGTSLPAFERVFNIAANSEQFALAFQCRQGTAMNMYSEFKVKPFPLFEKVDVDDFHYVA